MKATSAKPGQKLLCTTSGGTRRIAYFEKRVPRYGNQPAYNLLRVPDFEGLDGPNDKGFCSFTDKEMGSCTPA